MTLLIVSTHSHYEKYCNRILRILPKLWPGHPEVWVITNGDTIEHRNKIIVRSEDWVPRVFEGVKLIRKKYPDLKYAYIITEEMLPIRKCDPELLKRVELAAKQNNISFTAFVSYPWAWQDEIRINNLCFYKTPRDFPYYSQIQSTLWNLDYFLNVCEDAIAKGEIDPWSFEKKKTFDDHLVSDYKWPNFYTGILNKGFVSYKALKMIQWPEGLSLSLYLILQMILQSPAYFIYRILRASNRYTSTRSKEMKP